MDDKYIELLIEKCTDLNQNKSLFLHYCKEIEEFIGKFIKKVRELGVEDIYLDCYEPEVIHEFLKTSTSSEIETSSYFDCSIWDEYAKKDACFLMFETEYPGLMDDIDPMKIAISSKRKTETKPIYRKKVENCQLSWCIAAYPGKKWAEEVFTGKDSYNKLKQAIYHICMLDQEDPMKSWDNCLARNEKIMNYLNQLNLKKLHYKNSLGTDLELYLPKNYIFSSAKDTKGIVNMPSYEVFTSPDFKKTEGIVYATRPLIYNGVCIRDFYLRFSNGKVVEYDAKTGKDMLGEILQNDSQSYYLGECALVEKNSPIAKMNVVFGTTLIDENASCHLALGAGFPECIENGFDCQEEKLKELGVNVSKTHVDFMIGTNDLEIKGITDKEEEIVIFKDGQFDSEFLKCCL